MLFMEYLIVFFVGKANHNYALQSLWKATTNNITCYNRTKKSLAFVTGFSQNITR